MAARSAQKHNAASSASRSSRRATKRRQTERKEVYADGQQDRSTQAARQSCYVGIDGSKHGWCVALLCREESHHRQENVRQPRKRFSSINLMLCSTLGHVREALLHTSRERHLCSMAIDMPIGLPEHAERGGRECDRVARTILTKARAGARSKGSSEGVDKPLVGPSSIFTPPSRPALQKFANGGTHAQVSSANRESRVDKDRDGGESLGLSIQSFNILSKVQELDRNIKKGRGTHEAAAQFHISPELALDVFECHPEVAFLAMKARQAGIENNDFARVSALSSKKTLNGRLQRIDLLRSELDGTKMSIANSGVVVDDQDHPLPTDQWQCLEDRTMLAMPLCQSFHDAKAVRDTPRKVAIDDILDALVCACTASRFPQGIVSFGARDDQNKCAKDSAGLPMAISA